MLQNYSRSKQRKHHRYYERIRLSLIAPEATILPYQYIRPSTTPLGINATETNTDYDNERSTSPVYNIPARTTNYNETSSDTSNEDSSDGSVSVYTVRLYNRLEGRWENPRPNSILQPPTTRIRRVGRT